MLANNFFHITYWLHRSRYISIFVLKNPMAYNDDLFCFFICIWATLSSILIQFVLDFLPGKLPLSHHICTGKNPDLDVNKNMKVIRNYLMICGSLSIIFVYAFVNIRIAIFKRDRTIPPLSMALQNLKQKPLADSIVIACISVVALLNLSVVIKLQTIDMKESHIFPNYLYLYYQHLWLAHMFSISFICAYFVRN